MLHSEKAIHSLFLSIDRVRGGVELSSAGGRESNIFDVLRLFAALAVVVGHATVHLKKPFLWVGPQGQYWFHGGVAMFFIMSGFLVYRSCERCFETGRPIRHFFMNRFLRVAPAVYFYVAVALVAGLILGVIPFQSLNSASLWAWVASHVVLAPVYHPDTFRHFGIGVLNGSLWTIPVEVAFYVAVPLLCWAERRYKRNIVFTVFCLLSVAGVVGQWWLQTHMPESLVTKLYGVTPLGYLVYFGLGIAWSKVWYKAPRNGWIAVFCAVAYVGLDYNLVPIPLFLPVKIVLSALLLSYVTLWIGHHGPHSTTRILRFGDLSYGVYIWHMVVVNSFIYWRIPTMLGPWSGSTVTLVIMISLALAYLSWWLVEMRALKLKPFTSRRDSAETVPEPVQANA